MAKSAYALTEIDERILDWHWGLSFQEDLNIDTYRRNLQKRTL